jgi:hypothetical protein
MVVFFFSVSFLALQTGTSVLLPIIIDNSSSCSDLYWCMFFKPSTIFDCALNSASILKDYAQNFIVTLAWTARNLFQGFRYILEMYTFTLSETQTSVALKCRIIALFLKQSVFLKHDFDVHLHKVVSCARTLHFHSFFSLNNCPPSILSQPTFDGHTSDPSPGENSKYDYIGGGR